MVKLNDGTIDFISLENSKSDMSVKEKEKKVETFNISMKDPVTPVTEGDLDICVKRILNMILSSNKTVPCV